MTRFFYRKKYLRTQLFFGIFWMLWFFIQLFSGSNTWITWGWLVIGALYLGTYGYQVKFGYLHLKENTLFISGPFGKSIPLSEGINLKEFAGDFILTDAQNKKLTINTLIMDSESKIQLQSILENLRSVSA
jgi:hypothetical protein